ncbi:zinc-dependent alcohol dehydrogenase [Kushneria phosphatilytica]|uniref:Zinc-binding alcohol dehydrogenase n=1 Tax=Kushneria phosphatilytica TaxID=657387 RepID=A0A1S1P1K5_9GAMM|nr:zinc-binding alcohol dehydrogenase [Kushneria phosphatilytica]OHV12365.1 dehydrogenase [Kushneria phosphatilytica]QEL11351.1 zinc-binding alcohol dehydrogenase [Kushneria phosphatilytica]
MTVSTATAFWTIAAGQGELRLEGLTFPGSDEVHVTTLYSGISRGTETLVFNGRVPESEYQRMKAPFQSGEFPWPVKYGYTSVGRVTEGPASLVDRNVFCLHPHQDRYVVPAAAVTPLPEGLPPERAVLASNMETAINGLWDAGPLPGDRIAIIGGGVVGTLMARLCQQIPGTQVTLVDIDPTREPIADRLNIPFATPDNAPMNQDLLIHASGSNTGLINALRSAGMEARIIEMSWYGQQPVSLPLGEAFHSQRLTLRASQVGTIPPHQASRWDFKRRLTLALRLLRDDAELEVLIDGESPFTRLPETMARITASPGTLCHRVCY